MKQDTTIEHSSAFLIDLDVLSRPVLISTCDLYSMG